MKITEPQKGHAEKKILFRARAHEVASRSHEEFFSACPAGSVKNVVALQMHTSTNVSC